MNDTVTRDNRRALPRFLLILAASAIVGGCLGLFIVIAGERASLDAIWAWLDRLMEAITPWGIPVCTAGLLIPGFCLYRSAKKSYAAWDHESDQVYQAIEDKLSYALLLSALTMLAGFFFLAAGPIYHAAGRTAVSFLISLVLLFALQQRVVDLTRRMNPEKKGSIYDVKFQKKWLDSCDELERARIGQAAFRSFRTLNLFCPILWLVLVLLSFVTDIGLLPILVVTVIWGVLQVSYVLECVRLNRRRKG